MTDRTSRLLQLRTVTCFVSANVGQLIADPVHTLAQVARRLPANIREQVAGKALDSQRPTLQALGFFLRDQPTRLSPLLPAIKWRFIREPLTAYLSTVASDTATRNLGRTSHARLLWNRGDISGALQLALPWQRFFFADEAALLRAPMTTTLTPPTGQLHSGTTAPRALWCITNSLPHSTSGYAHRTHQLLTASDDLTRPNDDHLAYAQPRLSLSIVTRLGYPLVIGRWPESADEQVGNITYRRLIPWRFPLRSSRIIRRQAQQIMDVAIRTKATIVHTTTDYETGLPAYLAAKALGLPWVYELRGEREKTWAATFAAHLQPQILASERYQLIRQLETELARRADAVIALSEVQKASLIGRGVPAESISVIPNGCDDRMLTRPHNRQAAHHEVGLSDDHNELTLFGAISSIVDYEGLDTLVRALAILTDPQRSPHVNKSRQLRLVIVGDGVALPGLRALADELNVAEQCIFTGRLSSDKADQWYQSLDVFCLPRKDTAVTRMVTPMKSIPALAYGVPVLASDLPALREITPPQQPQWLLPPDDPQAWAEAIAKIVTTAPDDPIAAEWAQSCRQLAGQRTWQRGALRLQQIYQEISNNKP